jgi:hypothetical protein
MSELRCPHGRKVMQGRKLGLNVYVHMDDKKLCKYLHSGNGVEGVLENLLNNFDDFNSYFIFEESIMDLAKNYTTGQRQFAEAMKKNAVLKKLKSLYGNEQAMIEYLKPFLKVFNNNASTVNAFCHALGYPGEHLLRKIEYKGNCKYIPNSYTIDIGISVKSEYDITMNNIIKNKGNKKDNIKDVVSEIQGMINKRK